VNPQLHRDQVHEAPQARENLHRDGLKDPVLLLAVAIYSLAAFLIHSAYIYNGGPDAIAYFSIAKLYYSGNGALAINSHWSPLISWILVPFLALGISPESALKLSCIPVGAIIILGIWKLGEQLGLSRKYRRFSLLATVPALLSWAMQTVSADFLSTALVLWLWVALLHPGFGRVWRWSLLAGFFGGIGYLSKSYCFPYFVAAFSLAMLRNLLVSDQPKKREFAHFLAGFSLFLLVSLPWAAVISAANGKATIGTAGSFTLQYMAPSGVDVGVDQGLVPPPSEYAVSYWENPWKLPTPNWSPFASRADFIHFAKTINRNVWDALDAINGCCMAVGLAVVGALLGPRGRLLQRASFADPALGLLVLAIVFTSGYVLIFVAERYLWPASIAAILLGCFAIQKLDASGLFNRQSFLLLQGVFVVACGLKSPGMLARAAHGRQYYTQSLALAEIEGQRVAANRFLPGLHLAYYRNARFYGIPLKGMASEKVAASLKENGIGYFLLFEDEAKPDFLQDFTLEKKEIPGLKVFRRTDAPDG